MGDRLIEWRQRERGSVIDRRERGEREKERKRERVRERYIENEGERDTWRQTEIYR